ncbi:hypothetical protein GBAR_LOCUS19433 [Geodia barretti]|uniref:Uncharacterized protein n=1 Tax=Geodia barretti TaxID=519541 RepID=A0AA35SSH9_GEOBA|nr:hypothetical protein GBAR_LOCUS19433 [Geodia barretti]
MFWKPPVSSGTPSSTSTPRGCSWAPSWQFPRCERLGAARSSTYPPPPASSAAVRAPPTAHPRALSASSPSPQRCSTGVRTSGPTPSTPAPSTPPWATRSGPTPAAAKRPSSAQFSSASARLRTSPTAPSSSLPTIRRS